MLIKNLLLTNAGKLSAVPKEHGCVCCILMGWRAFFLISTSECYNDGPILGLVICCGKEIQWSKQRRTARQSSRLTSSEVQEEVFLPTGCQSCRSKQNTCLGDNFLLLVSGSGLQGKWCVCHKFDSPRIWLAEFEDCSRDCSWQIRTILPNLVSNSPHCWLPFFCSLPSERVTVVTCIGESEVLLPNPVIRHYTFGKGVS